MSVLKVNFHGNSNVGLYGFATDKYCVIGKGLGKEILKKIEEALKVPVYEIDINNSHLIGVYCTGNDGMLLVPDILKETEEERLKSLKLPYKVVKTKFVALGNNIVIKDKNAIINPEFEKGFDKQLEMFKPFRMKIGGHNTVGSCMVVNKNGCLINRDVDEKEIKKIEKIMGGNIEIGSINMGNPYVRSGIIANSHGYIIGEDTSGVEVMRIDQALKK